jgi:hypothetical protein
MTPAAKGCNDRSDFSKKWFEKRRASELVSSLGCY